MASTGIINVLDYASVQDAVAVIPPEGALLYFPPGVHIVTPPVDIPSKTKVFGVGPASIVRRKQPSNTSPVFRCQGATDVTFSSLAIDVNYSSGIDQLSGIRFTQAGGTPCVNCLVENCYFTTGAIEPSYGEREYAVLSDNSQYIKVVNNRIINMEIRASSSGAKAGPCMILANHITNPHTYAISWSGSLGTDDQENLIIGHNTIENVPGKAAILIGSVDTANASGKLYRVHIMDNQISGIWGGGSNECKGILVILATDTQDLHINANIVRSTNQAPSPNSTGIELKRPDSGCTVRKVHVQGNTIDSTQLHGVIVNADDVEDLWVTGNEVINSAGIKIEGGGQRIFAMGNHADRGLTLHANLADILRTEIQGNICRNANSGSPTAGVLLQSDSGRSLQANVRGNKCYDDQSTKTQQYGVAAIGAGTLDTILSDNDLRDNLTAETFGV